MSDPLVLTCACGKRLLAPGASPGRVGRCPACGGELRVPEPGTAQPTRPAPAPARDAPSPRPKKARKKQVAAAPETDIWDGFIPPPNSVETQIRQSLLYPLWGASGVVLLVVWPPLLWFLSMPLLLVAFSPPYVSRGNTFGLGALFLALPACLGLIVVGGYALLFLARVLASSALGERFHPRWPEWELASACAGMFRWFLALLVGAVVGGFPAVVYWINCGDLDFFDRMILAELLAVGAVYALMALLAAILHEDVWGVNPVTVGRAVFRVGWGYAQPCLVAGAAIVVAATVLAASFEVESPAASAFLYYVFWFLFFYEAMVVLRVLGLFYYRNARKLNWFRDRTRWGV